ncbi:MAG: 4-hydroxy-3-methylbut-2-enyl diphosphate reductase [Clostridia bacterium]|nr:4-hydroxy-3-methylbut-2-enyl diphosphate reductase [Clostridia bacterium]MDE7328729.1 4-hydroxy-3-methylbut-2-enyl diphosphate reductase [Clostridia bacterium]
MPITVAKNSGFCQGVKRAVDVAMKIDAPAAVYGKLIHNESVLEKLKDRGVECIDDLEKLDGRKLIIRSHGVGKDIYDYLDENGVDYVDCTCVFVKKIHKIVYENYLAGKQIIIIGNPEHPEVKGINGWCENSAIIFNGETDVKFDEDKEYCLVVQTTYDHEKVERFIKFLQNNIKTLDRNNTICYTTLCRQEECNSLSKDCDLMLVLGSKNSSNTSKLFDISAKNCPQTFLIEKLSDLESVKVDKKIKIGIVAGASTPPELIEEVKNLMNESQEINKIENETAKEDFGALLDASQAVKSMNIRAGKAYQCRVISANEEGIAVNFGGKKDGFVCKDDAEMDGVEYLPENYKEGDVFTAIVIDKASKSLPKEYVYFSKKTVDQRNKENSDAVEMLSQPEFKLEMKECVKNGLKGYYGGYSIFVPASQIKIAYVTEADLPKYVGKTLRLRLIKSNKDDPDKELDLKSKKSFIASQKVILEEEQKKKEDEIWAFFEKDKIVTGKVKRFAEFGAFVSVNGFDCLVHNSDASYNRNVPASEVFELGKTYEFIVRYVSRENGKVKLGYKQLQKKPYEIAFEKYPVGSVINGTVRDVKDYGAFVLIEDNIDGLVPVSEISHSYTKNPADVLKPGDPVTAQIIRFEDNRITLSIKALIAKEEAPVEDTNVSEEAYQEAKEKRAKKNAKKFDSAAVASTPAKKARAVVKDDEEQVSSWTSEESASATMADLFKGLKLDIK